jgi:hypothetical protein
LNARSCSSLVAIAGDYNRQTARATREYGHCRWYKILYNRSNEYRSYHASHPTQARPRAAE